MKILQCDLHASQLVSNRWDTWNLDAARFGQWYVWEFTGIIMTRKRLYSIPPNLSFYAKIFYFWSYITIYQNCFLCALYLLTQCSLTNEFGNTLYIYWHFAIVIYNHIHLKSISTFLYKNAHLYILMHIFKLVGFF